MIYAECVKQIYWISHNFRIGQGVFFVFGFFLKMGESVKVNGRSYVPPSTRALPAREGSDAEIRCREGARLMRLQVHRSGDNPLTRRSINPQCELGVEPKL